MNCDQCGDPGDTYVQRKLHFTRFLTLCKVCWGRLEKLEWCKECGGAHPARKHQTTTMCTECGEQLECKHDACAHCCYWCEKEAMQ